MDIQRTLKANKILNYITCRHDMMINIEHTVHHPKVGSHHNSKHFVVVTSATGDGVE